MNDLKNILVAVDFSPASAAALEEAVRVGRQQGAIVRAVHVIDAAMVAEVEQTLRALQEDVRGEFVRDAEDRWRGYVAGNPAAKDVAFDVLVDDRVDAILRRVEAGRVDLLVLGAQGTAGPEAGAGPLAVACVRRAPTRVLVVGSAHRGPFQRVVACVDFSDRSGPALEQAAAIAARDGAKLYALHAFRGPWDQLRRGREGSGEASHATASDAAEHYRRALSDRLREFCGRHEGARAAGVETHLVDHPSAGIGICEFARRVSADLLVLGTAGKSAVRHLISGSTTERVLQETPCSVLAVKPRHFVHGP